jgi:Ca-activated chloride channel family protein
VLDGKVGIHDKQFVYELDFKPQTDGKPFVEELWARRKVGYLLDQIRINGEQKELVDEVVRLAKGYGITTPYTSYLIMPDAPVELASAEASTVSGRLRRGYYAPPALNQSGFGGGGRAEGHSQERLEDFAKRLQKKEGELGNKRGAYQDETFARLPADRPDSDSNVAATRPAAQAAQERFADAKRLKSTLDKARWNYEQGKLLENQVRKLGVDLSVSTKDLKNQSQIQATAIRRVAKRNCMEFGGVWIDEAFTERTPTLSIKAQSDAYFQILERQPQMKEVFQLGNHVVWITPNGTGLVIDTADGKDQMSDQEIDILFASN